MNNLIYVCSPYRGKIRRNKRYARKLTKIAMDNGFAPVTPHLYLTEVLDENKPEERSQGMAAGRNILKECNFILIGDKYGITSGMREEILLAILNGIPMLYERDGKIYFGNVQVWIKKRGGNKAEK